MNYLCSPKPTVRELSSAGSEHLPYKQRVGGSNPSAPTKMKPLNRVAFVFLPIHGIAVSLRAQS